MAWIAAQLERKQTSEASQPVRQPMPFWRSLFRVPYMAAAAAVIVAATLGISLYVSEDFKKPNFDHNIGIGEPAAFWRDSSYESAGGSGSAAGSIELGSSGRRQQLLRCDHAHGYRPHGGLAGTIKSESSDGGPGPQVKDPPRKAFDMESHSA